MTGDDAPDTSGTLETIEEETNDQISVVDAASEKPLNHDSSKKAVTQFVEDNIYFKPCLYSWKHSPPLNGLDQSHLSDITLPDPTKCISAGNPIT